jgi:hypothetical protein
VGGPPSNRMTRFIPQPVPTYYFLCGAEAAAEVEAQSKQPRQLSQYRGQRINNCTPRGLEISLTKDYWPIREADLG